MAELRTEEEQVQALKQWWDENGKSLLLGLAVAIAAVLAWQGWQKQQATQAENASVLYQNLLDAVVTVIGPQQDENQQATALHLSKQLKDDYESSAYAKYAALIMARVAVEKGDLAAAQAELEWIDSRQPNDAMKVMVAMRKARIVSEQGDHQQALLLLSAVSAGSYKVSVEELKGDIYLASGDEQKAREAYQAAVAAAGVQSGRPLLQLKLDNLAVEGK